MKAITKYLTKFMVPKHQKSFCHQTLLPRDCMVYLLIHWNNMQITLKITLNFSKLKVSPNVTLKFNPFYICGTGTIQYCILCVICWKKPKMYQSSGVNLLQSHIQKCLCSFLSNRMFNYFNKSVSMCSRCLRLKKKPILRQKVAEKEK